MQEDAQPSAVTKNYVPSFRYWRTARGFDSQQALADAFNERFRDDGETTTQQTIGRWERGEVLIPLDQLDRICAILDVTPDQMMAPSPDSYEMAEDEESRAAAGLKESFTPFPHHDPNIVVRRGKLMRDPKARRVLQMALELPGELPLDLAVEIMRQYDLRHATRSHPPRRA